MMIVVDVETTGTNPAKHSIVSIGAINMLDTEQRLYLECRIWDGSHIDPVALEVNGFTENQIKDSNKLEEGEAVRQFLEWFGTREVQIFGAQNPLFDLGFLQAAAGRAHIDFSLAHRSIDLHTVAYAHMIKAGIEPPVKNHKSDINSDSIMRYVGIEPEPRPHKAINGAIWEAEAFSRLLYGRNLLKEFAESPIRF